MKNGLMQPTELPQHSNSTHNSILEGDEKSDGEGIGLLAVFISDLFITYLEMEKLIELLNEYRKEKGERNLNEFEVSQTLDSLNYLRLFIKWLVDNDKIDRERINNRWGDMSIHFTDEELFIMSLSTSNTPIEDLVSYLR